MDNTEKTRVFEKIKKQIEDNSRRKVRLEEKLEVATQNLKKLVTDIKAEGYDPKNLATMKTEIAERLAAELDKAQKLVDANTSAIAEIEASL